MWLLRYLHYNALGDYREIEIELVGEDEVRVTLSNLQRDPAADEIIVLKDGASININLEV